MDICYSSLRVLVLGAPRSLDLSRSASDRQTRFSPLCQPPFSRPAPKKRSPTWKEVLSSEPRERKKEERKARGGGKNTPVVPILLSSSPLFLPLTSIPPLLSCIAFPLSSAGALAQSATQAQTATNEAIAELAVASVDATAAAAAPALAIASATSSTDAAAAAAAAAAEPRVIEVATAAEPQLAVSETTPTLEAANPPLTATPAAAAAAAVPVVAAAAATPQALTNEGPPPQDLSLPLTYYEWSGLYVKRLPDGEEFERERERVYFSGLVFLSF